MVAVAADPPVLLTVIVTVMVWLTVTVPGEAARVAVKDGGDGSAWMVTAFDVARFDVTPPPLALPLKVTVPAALPEYV